MAVFCFVGPKYDEPHDRKLFEAADKLLPLLEEDRSMAHLLVRIGKFPSVKEAKRNGWAVDIPIGWAYYKIGNGKKRVDVYIWNPSCTLAEFEEQELL